MKGLATCAQAENILREIGVDGIFTFQKKANTLTLDTNSFHRLQPLFVVPSFWITTRCNWILRPLYCERLRFYVTLHTLVVVLLSFSQEGVLHVI